MNPTVVFSSDVFGPEAAEGQTIIHCSNTIDSKTMHRLYYSLLALLFSSTVMISSAQDTTRIQTLEFSDITKRRGWYQFPEGDQQYRKVLMQYTLKCDNATTQDGFPCGEWDYTTYTDLFSYEGVGTQYYQVGAEILDSVYFTDSPVVDIHQHYSYSPVIDETLSENEVSIGLSAEGMQDLLAADRTNGRSQFIISASEAATAGLTTGAIYSMSLDVLSDSDPLDRLIIRMADAPAATFAEERFVEASFSTVFDAAVPMDQIGLNTLAFSAPYAWDGTSDILVDLAFSTTEGMESSDIGAQAATDRCLVSAGNEGHVDFESGQTMDLPSEIFADVDQEITVSFWANIDTDDVPSNFWTFEGVDGQNRRVINAHLPWSNGRIYWDAGHNMSGTYDRIDEQASLSQYAGGWHHFAFVKNAAEGVMTIYIDGEEFHSANGKPRSMAGIEKFRIAGRADQSFSGDFQGKMDEFQIWSKALDQAVIQDWMYKSVDGSHPDYSQLEAAYDFNSPSGVIVQGYSPSAHQGVLFGGATMMSTAPTSMFINATSSPTLPSLSLTQGEFVWHLDSTLVSTETPRAPMAVILSEPFIDQDLTGMQYTYLDTLSIFTPGVSMTFGPDGELISETAVEADGFFVNEFSQQRHQIQNYVTPYGIGLSLGNDGFRWTYEVTDYAPVLSGMIEIAAGNQQELIDLEFEFIEGTPPREVLGFETLWLGDFDHRDIADDVVIPAMEVALVPEASEFRVKTRTTGHWFGGVNNCAEFCPKDFHLDVNGQMEFEWLNWTECADNPVTAQGGTWIYDRAGWCPGAFADTYDLEITPYINDGEANTINFGMEDYPSNGGEGNYRTTGILLQYGAKNHQVDAEIQDIISPNNWEFHRRRNPVCKDPVISFRNLGAEVITSATFSYRTLGGAPATYDWTGSLEFNEDVEVTLPIPDIDFWAGDGQSVFEVEILTVNGQADEYADNDKMRAEYEFPDVYDESFVVWLKTNNAPAETEWWIYDSNGDVVYNRDPTLANTNYRDTIILADGCYHFRLEDTGQDGLSFFANNDGSGFIRMNKLNGLTLQNFGANFGSFINHHFVVGNDPTSLGEEELDQFVNVYPNPGQGIFNLSVETYIGSQLLLEVLDAQGKLVASYQEGSVPDRFLHEIDLRSEPNGIYFVRLLIDGRQVVKRIVKQ